MSLEVGIQFLSEVKDLKLSLSEYHAVVVEVVPSVGNSCQLVLEEVPALTEVFCQVFQEFHVVRGVASAPMVSSVSPKCFGICQVVDSVAEMEVRRVVEVRNSKVRAIGDTPMCQVSPSLVNRLEDLAQSMSVSRS